MDIRNWPMDQVMQLPDSAFGRRWAIGVSCQKEEVGTCYDISEAGLPERCVIWQLYIIATSTAFATYSFSLALGDVLPVNDAQFDANEYLFRDIGQHVLPRRELITGVMCPAIDLRMRKLVETGGRRLIGRFVFTTEVLAYLHVFLVVSSVPKEVPDWLVSG